MREAPATMTEENDDAPMAATYAKVLVLEVLVLLALWAAGRYFGTA